MGFIKGMLRSFSNTAADIEYAREKSLMGKLPKDLVNFYKDKMYDASYEFIKSYIEPQGMACISCFDYVGGAYYLVWYERGIYGGSETSCLYIKPAFRREYLESKKTSLK